MNAKTQRTFTNLADSSAVLDTSAAIPDVVKQDAVTFLRRRGATDLIHMLGLEGIA